MAQSLPSDGDPIYRKVAEPRIIEHLRVCGYIGGTARDGRQDTELHDTIERLVALGLPYTRDDDTTRCFDPAEVINFLKYPGDRFWPDRMIATARALTAAWQPSAAPRRFAVTMHRRFHLAGIAPGTPLRLHMPNPIEDATLHDLTLRLDLPDGLAADIRHCNGRHEARLPAPADGAVTLTLHASFVASPAARLAAPTAAETATYLRPNEGLIQVTPRVQALAADQSGRDPAETVRQLWNFVVGHLSIGALHYDRPPAAAVDRALETGWADCQVGSALLIALCRARGIPARLVGGYFLYPALPATHFWAEIWLDDHGWAPFDLQSWELSAGGRDAAWRNIFAGTVDYRMKTQCLPHRFTPPPIAGQPPCHDILMRRAADGLAIEHRDVATGRIACTDTISVDTP